MKQTLAETPVGLGDRAATAVAAAIGNGSLPLAAPASVTRQVGRTLCCARSLTGHELGSIGADSLSRIDERQALIGKAVYPDLTEASSGVRTPVEVQDHAQYGGFVSRLLNHPRRF